MFKNCFNMVRGIDEKRAFSSEKILSLNKLCCIILTVTHTDEHAFVGEKSPRPVLKYPLIRQDELRFGLGYGRRGSCNIGGRLSCVLFSEG